MLVLKYKIKIYTNVTEKLNIYITLKKEIINFQFLRVYLNKINSWRN